MIAAERRRLERELRTQREWITARGGSVLGYIAHYGEADGEVIYRADKAHLDDLEARLAGRSRREVSR